MALGSWIFTLRTQSRKISIRIIHYYPIAKRHFFYVSIENLSRLPILISQIYMINENGEKIECRVIPKKVFEQEKLMVKKRIEK